MSDTAMGDPSLDRANLYLEETFTDLRVGSLRRLTPVKPDGSNDSSRETVFIGQAQVMSQAGPLPIQCQIDATTIDEAIDKFPEAIKRGEAFETVTHEAATRFRRSRWGRA